MNDTGLKKSLGTWDVMVAGIALVVASSTLVSDFTGYFTLGYAFIIAVLLGFVVNLLLGISAADLSVSHIKAGALYDYCKEIFKGRKGKMLGVFFGIIFFGMFSFAASGEIASGAFVLQMLAGIDVNLVWYILALAVLAVIPNIFGIKTAAWINTALLLLMIGIRWFFGLAGFFGWGDAGTWSAANLDAGVGVFEWFGDTGIITAGLTLAFWSFLGIEFACSLAEETKNPKKALPRGIILGLVMIMVTSTIMGTGVTGTMPVAEWQTIMNGDHSADGQAPQLAVGYTLFGELGFILMAIASISATLGSLSVAMSVLPRIIYSISRDGNFFGPVSAKLGKLNKKYSTPVNATIFTFVISFIPSLLSSEVIDWVFSAAYIWGLLYIAFHVLAIFNRKFNPQSNKAFKGKWFVPAAYLGIITTALTLYFAFEGSHWHYGSRALIVILAALVTAFSSLMISDGKVVIRKLQYAFSTNK